MSAARLSLRGGVAVERGSRDSGDGVNAAAAAVEAVTAEMPIYR